MEFKKIAVHVSTYIPPNPQQKISITSSRNSRKEINQEYPPSRISYNDEDTRRGE